jgi:hypothetical protein
VLVYPCRIPQLFRGRAGSSTSSCWRTYGQSPRSIGEGRSGQQDSGIVSHRPLVDVPGQRIPLRDTRCHYEQCHLVPLAGVPSAGAPGPANDPLAPDTVPLFLKGRFLVRDISVRGLAAGKNATGPSPTPNALPAGRQLQGDRWPCGREVPLTRRVFTARLQCEHRGRPARHRRRRRSPGAHLVAIGRRAGCWPRVPG